MSFTDPRVTGADLRCGEGAGPGVLAQQPGGYVGDWVGGGLDVGGSVLVGGGVVGGSVVGGSVVGGVVGGSVVGGVVGGSVVGGVVGGSVVAGSHDGPEPTMGQPAACRHENGGLAGPWPLVDVCDGAAVVGIAAELDAALVDDGTGTQPRTGSPIRLAPPPPVEPEPPSGAGAAPMTSGARPKIITSTRTQIDTAPSAITPGADRDSACRTRARVVGGGGGGATTTGRCLLRAPTTAYPVLIRCHPRRGGGSHRT